jgi:diaminopimelate epimerase
MTGPGIPFVKGHGTGNDFVLLPNSDGDLTVRPSLVAALCDRRRGIGADGVLVVARTADHPEVAAQAGRAPWFMDYRNADGSVAEMCGNGSRVFVAYLLEAGLAAPGTFDIATRGGVRSVQVDPAAPAWVSVDMGLAAFLEADATVGPVDGPAGGVARPALGVALPNPHAVTWVDDLAQAGTLARMPAVQPIDAFPDGTNVEFVQVLAEDHVAMRVFERGVGETLSCGTGACAAAVATLRGAGAAPAGQRMRVDVPGGTVEVVWRADGHVELHGPAVLVARGTIDPDWWELHA